jgi:hypothetical protein
LFSKPINQWIIVMEPIVSKYKCDGLLEFSGVT